MMRTTRAACPWPCLMKTARSCIQATYVDDGSGFVEVELFVTPEDGGSPISERYKVNGAYYVSNMDDEPWLVPL